jgi:hypothetical protein
LERQASGPSNGAYGKIVIMGNSAIPTALDGLLDPLSRCLDAESAQRVAEFRVDAAVQARIDTLAQRANDGVLSEEERAEYEAFINAADFISILKLKTRRQLNSNRS